MKKLFALAAVAACALSEFTSELVEKYSIEVLNEGDSGTAPSVGDSVSMHY